MMPRTKAKKAPPAEPAAFTASPVKGITVPLPIPAVALLVPEPADAEAAAPPTVDEEDPVAVEYGGPDERNTVADMVVLVALPEAGEVPVPKHVTETWAWGTTSCSGPMCVTAPSAPRKLQL